LSGRCLPGVTPVGGRIKPAPRVFEHLTELLDPQKRAMNTPKKRDCPEKFPIRAFDATR
jgi:hypothetical protein